MKKTTAKIVQISDILQWHEKGEIELSPKYQRNSVWNEKAKAYLIDTIVRGLPIPPIFLRQKIDVVTKKTFREIIDGQQRLRAILEFVVDERFVIKKSHNKELGNKKYSDLEDDIKEAILEYEIVAEVVTEKDDPIIYDMFARLNSNNSVLNRQEIRNAKYWGEYKVFIYRLASYYREFFIAYNILSDTDFSRMKDVEFITSLAVALTEGIGAETPTAIDNIYSKYDREFPLLDETENKFNHVFAVISNIFSYMNGNVGCFKNKNYFYTLFCSIAHHMYGIENIEIDKFPLFTYGQIQDHQDKIIKKIVQFTHDYENAINDKENKLGLYDELSEFAKHHQVRTTSKSERISRISFLSNYIGSDINDD